MKMRRILLFLAIAIVFGVVSFLMSHDTRVNRTTKVTFSTSKPYQDDKIVLKCHAIASGDLYVFKFYLLRYDRTTKRRVGDLYSIKVTRCEIADNVQDKIHDASGWFNGYFEFIRNRHVESLDNIPVTEFYSNNSALYSTFSRSIKDAKRITLLISFIVTYTDGTEQHKEAEFDFEVSRAQFTTLTLSRKI